MKKLLLIALLLANAPAYSATSEQITNALSKYCVPIPINQSNWQAPDGYPTCGGVFEADYIKGQPCKCADSTYLVYDPVLRRCKPKCPTGYFVKGGASNCSAGQYKLKISK